jgi:hypothetical protein
MDEALKQKIISLRDGHRTMKIATIRPDGWPQTTTVGYANEGFYALFPLRQRQPEFDSLRVRHFFLVDQGTFENTPPPCGGATVASHHNPTDGPTSPPRRW